MSFKKRVRTNRSPPCLYNAKYCNEEIGMSEILNLYFASVITVENTNGIGEAFPPQTHYFFK